jgi:hypothetical protein
VVVFIARIARISEQLFDFGQRTDLLDVNNIIALTALETAMDAIKGHWADREHSGSHIA